MTLRIVVAAHKPYPMPSGDAYLPVQVGLVHYRRHFKAAPERIAALLERHDIILPRKIANFLLRKFRGHR